MLPARDTPRAMSRENVEPQHFALWTLADGLVTRMQTFADHAQALEAAGRA